jgi:hypothetical protein
MGRSIPTTIAVKLVGLKRNIYVNAEMGVSEISFEKMA